MENLSDLWDKAKVIYEQRTGRRIQSSDPIFSRVQSWEDFQAQLDAQNSSFVGYRNENRRIYNGLAKVIAPVSAALAIIQRSIGNTPYAPLAAVLGSTAYLLQACQSVSRSYDAVELLFQRVGDLTARFAEYDFGTVEPVLKSKIVDILAQLLEINGKAEAIVKRKRFKQWFREVLLQDDDINSSLIQLQQYVEHEMGLVVTLTYGRVKAVEQIATDVKAQVDNIATDTQNAAELQNTVNQYISSESESRLLKDTFHNPTFDELFIIHHSRVRILTQDTGYWLSNDPAWYAWTEEHAPILWVLGKPGVGKSMLAARTIETLQAASHKIISDSVTSVAFIYFKDDDFRLQNCLEMLKAAALQIARQDARFKKHLISCLNDNPECVASSSILWKRCFLSYYTSPQTTASSSSSAYLVIDGLDEASMPQRVELLDCLAALIYHADADRGCRLQALVSCRPEVLADLTFFGSDQFNRIIQVTGEQNSDDIRTFIKSKLNDINILKILKRQGQLTAYRQLAKMIYTSVDEKADGMFLWASLMLDDIRRCSSPESITKALQQAPAGLDEMLHHIFLRLSAETVTQDSYLPHLLAWMASTEEPLTLAQLYVLIHAASEHHPITLEDDLRKRLSSLFDLRDIVAVDDGEEDQFQSKANSEQVDRFEADDLDFLDDFDPCPPYAELDRSTKQSDSDNPLTDEIIPGSNFESSLGDMDAMPSFQIPPSWHKIRVKFSHGRVKGYLLEEGTPSRRRWNDCSIVPEDLNEYRAQIVQICLRILRSATWDPYRTSPIEVYCRLNWMKYCRTIDWPQVPQATRISALNDLAGFCADWRLLLASSKNVDNSFVDCWYDSDEYPKAICAALANDVGKLDTHLQVFAEKAARFPKYLFEPLVKGCAEAWLTTTGEFAEGKLEEFDWTMVSCIAHFMSLREDGSLTKKLRDRPSTAKAILACARYAGLPEDNTWCKAVGRAILETGGSKAAHISTEYFTRAFEFCPNDWGGWQGLANVYGYLKKNYAEAVKAIMKAIDYFPSERKSFLAYAVVLKDKATWLWYSKQPQKGLAAIKEAFEISYRLDPYAWVTDLVMDQYFTLTYFDLVEGSKNAHELIEFVHRLRDVQIEGHGGSMFTLFLRQQAKDELYTFFDRIIRLESSSAKEKMNELIKEALPRACNVDLWKTGDMTRYWLTFKGAPFLERSCGDNEAAVRLYEHYLTWSHVEDNGALNDSWPRSAIVFSYAAILLRCAIDTRSAGEDPARYIQKLESLAMMSSKGKQLFSASAVALAYGLWLRRYGGAPERTWKEVLRPALMQQLYLLNDDDPYNDQEAYFNLGRALVCAGDIVNARIAYGIGAKPYEANLKSDLAHPDANGKPLVGDTVAEDKSEPIAEAQIVDATQTPVSSHGSQTETTSEPEAQGENEDQQAEVSGEQGSGPVNITASEPSLPNPEPATNLKYTGFFDWIDCDGPCGRETSTYTELWTCQICMDVDFCDQCVNLVRADKIPLSLCNSDHEFMCYFPLSQEAKAIADPLVEGRYEPLQEWLDTLRKNWTEPKK